MALEAVELDDSAGPEVQLPPVDRPFTKKPATTTGGWPRNCTRHTVSAAITRRLTGSPMPAQSSSQNEMYDVGAGCAVTSTVVEGGERACFPAARSGDLAGSGSSYVIDVEGGVPRLVCEQCLLGGFLADSRRVLGVWGDRRTIGVIDTAAGTRQELVRARDSRLNRPHASPDNRWLAFRELHDTGNRVFVVPLTPGRPQPPDAWQPVHQPTTTGRPCGWSLDGRTMLMLLDTDGFRCLWGQRVGPGGLAGGVFPVHHFHGGQMDSGGPSTSLGNPVTAGGFLYECIEQTGNVWRLTRPGR